ncbi:winged helix-turn-helix domain-containing protein [Kineococcus rhizosphaerae]|uniref:MarR family protein n=1 Tax=Kineococcus rhizosphaerae TaxID=559628 RepID=A0A2T0QKU7_9ACTN|nr:winged helix-turn-helix domain-containing protein [Kineococcus rhizosphaerae]PRY04922.1 MarR family protein [Kineococcus rhizosphaerae]
MSLWGSITGQTAPPAPPTTDAALYEIGAAGASLLAAICRFGDDGRSISELAQASAVPKATASRTAARLVEAGLIEDRGSGRERQLVLNRASPHLGEISALLWLTHGVNLPPEPGTPTHLSGFEQARWTPFAVDGDVARSVPAMLRSEPYSGARELPGESYDGPNVSTARAEVLRLRRLRSRIVRFEPWLQTTYYKGSRERDRDLIHLTIGQDVAAAQAQNSLTFSAGDGAREGYIGRLAWAHAIYCLDAEVVWLLRVGQLLEQVSNASTVMHKHRHQVELLRERVEAVTAHAERAGSHGDGSVSDDSGAGEESAGPDAADEAGARARDRDARIAQRNLAALQQELAARRADLAAAQDALDGFYRHGGTPGVHEVGTAGEGLISVQALATARTYAEQVRQMAAQPSFVAWREQHPEVADQFPLTSLQQALPS